MKKITYENYLIFRNYIIKNYGNSNLLREEGVEYKVNNPHDKMFRTILDNKKEATKFINKLLEKYNEKLIYDIEKYNRKFVGNSFRNKESDIIYKVKEKDIFFLIEHQSKVDYSMPYRMLDYSGAIINSAIDTERLGKKDYKIPEVYPIVLYTGRKKWDVEGGMINYSVIDINDYTEKELLENDCFVFQLMLLEKAKNLEELITHLKNLINKDIGSTNKKFLQRVIYYILRNEIGEENSNNFIKELEERKSDETMMEEIIRGALRKNFSEGKKEGKEEQKENMIFEMLKNKLEDNLIKKITKSTQTEIDAIKEKMQAKV